jgi:DNA-binding MarR family transcriptional regulator
LDAIYVSKLVRVLERGGLVNRTTHTRDPRAVQLTLTPAGEQTITQAVGTVRALQQRLTEPLGERRGELVETLRELLNHAEEGEPT